ncbi:hypothetical protein ACFQ5N_01050 [Lutibacter holmesii]|uniref:Uncharacterized protein n=1 Tax=Lutibacter holmesii TaxID=1137985 RepID=A0ABW3WKI4_9FLAO
MRTEIEFEDVSIIRFLDGEDILQSFYVLEHEFSKLKIRIKNFVL